MSVKLTLKTIPPDDYRAYHELINDPLISQMSATIPHPVDFEFARQRLLARAAGERVLKGIVQRGAYAGGILVGDGSLFTNEQQQVKIEFCVHADHRGKGYASEIASRLVKLARDHGHFGAIVAHFAKDNPISGTILAKLGFTDVGEMDNQSVGRSGVTSYYSAQLPAVDSVSSCVLEPLKIADINWVYALQHDPIGAELAGVAGEFVSESVFRKNMEVAIAQQHNGLRIFSIKAAGKMVGYIGCFRYSEQKFRISYWLIRSSWGQGIATAALNGLLHELPEKLLNKKLYASVIEGNIASVKILEKFGFILLSRSTFHSAAHGRKMQQLLYRR